MEASPDRDASDTEEQEPRQNSDQRETNKSLADSTVRSMDIGGEIVPKLSKLPIVSIETDINDKYYLDSPLFCLDNEDSNLTLDSKLYKYENKSFKNRCS
ncbi:Hypothetical predicted protein, partial [Mytilus galloprovincialis]